ncbi:protein of unknown function [Oenococcus oeni]|nr:hypothetical protein OENI_190017 [Oenococcus oeni]SYW03248.1 hypothetical protein OENI_60143 [Oenococcus oeni]SYW18799.1 hypothetical protein OENI_50145 [Oenococcus oeni]VDC14468.1 protein of unknown function [Oenococcus oeni]
MLGYILLLRCYVTLISVNEGGEEDKTGKWYWELLISLGTVYKNKA